MAEIDRKHVGQGTPAEKWIAAALGFAFLAVLAYAGLRERPITDPGQLVMLRVVAAVTAAACAALIPGFIEVKFKTYVRAGGAIAVFAIVWFTNPPALVSAQTAEAKAPRATLIVPNPNAAANIDPDDANASPYQIEIAGAKHDLHRRGVLIGGRELPKALEAKYRSYVPNGDPQRIDVTFDREIVKTLHITYESRPCAVPTFDQLDGDLWALEPGSCK